MLLSVQVAGYVALSTGGRVCCSQYGWQGMLLSVRVAGCAKHDACSSLLPEPQAGVSSWLLTGKQQSDLTAKTDVVQVTRHNSRPKLPLTVSGHASKNKINELHTMYIVKSGDFFLLSIWNMYHW